MARARRSIILSSVLGLSTLVSAGVSSAIVPQAEPVDPGSALAVVTAGPSPINVYDELTITVTCPAPPDSGANAAVYVGGHWQQLIPDMISGSSFSVVYTVPTMAGLGLTAYGSCVSQNASASTSNGVVVDVIPLQVPTPFAIPASITVSPTDVHPGDVVHVDVRCSGAPPTADMGVWTYWVDAVPGDGGTSLMPYVTVDGNGYVVDFPVPAAAPLGHWQIGAFCDLSPDAVIPGAPRYDFTRDYTVSAAPTSPSVPTLPPTL